MAESEQKPIFLVDGSSYIFRAYHALPNLATSAGVSTGAAYGVAQMLTRLVTEYEPDELGVVFDAPGPTFRSEIYADYKANRPPMPEDLREQLPYIYELVAAFGLPTLIEEGVEADDVIATLAAQAEAAGREVVIVTGDKDLAQLVDERTILLDTMKDKVFDEATVRERWGVGPEAIADFLALVGDTSDNVPGVPGIGEKTAAKLLAEYGSVENLLDHLDELKGKRRENLEAHAEQLRMAKDLVTVRRQLELDRRLDELARGAEDLDTLRRLFQELEFHTLLRQLLGEEAAEAGPAADYRCVTSEADLQALAERLRAAGRFAVDTETTSLSAVQAQLVGLSFATEAGAADYVPVGHTGEGAEEQLDPERVRAVLGPVLADPGLTKVGQNLKYDLSVLLGAGYEVAGPFEDTMLMSYVLNPTRHNHDLDTLAAERLGRATTKFADMAGKGAKQITFDQVPVAAAVDYAGEDAEITLALLADLEPELAGQTRLQALYRDLELPLMPILAGMERTGVRLDTELLGRLSEELAGEMAEAEGRAHELAGRAFNLNSPKQIQAVLFDELGLPVVKRTPKGAPSTNEDVLSQLAEDYPLPDQILRYRSLAKLKSTYTDALPRLINPETGRVHTSYHQANTATGRLSSAEPNLQNIPVRTEQGRRIRKAFVPEGGWTMVAGDYSQIELRLMAHLSGDARLTEAFRNGEDIHAATASEVFGVTEVNDSQRRAAKAINFGLIYGMSAWGLARQLEIQQSDAQAYIDAYFERYPGVRTYMETAREQAREKGWVETLRGRRLYLPDIGSSNPAVRAAAERTAINAPLQGSAADIIKQAMLDVASWLEGEGLATRMLMQVHDELVFECPPGEVERVVSELPRAMTRGTPDLDVALEVEVGQGDNWEEAH